MSANEPVVLAHRGLLRQAPENTPAAYIAAFELGFGIEVDVRFTADTELVMLHDEALDRTTSGQGPLIEKRVSDLASLDAGLWFDPAFAGQRIPTLTETCEMARTHGRCDVLIGLDIKESEPPVEEMVCRTLQEFGLMKRVLGIGNLLRSPELRERFKSACADFPATRRVGTPDDLADALSDPTADWLFVIYTMSAEQIEEAHQAGKRVFIVGDQVQEYQPENWLMYRDRGVDLFCTDYPIECHALWRERRG